MLDLPDIQGIVLSGYAHMPHSRFLFLRVENPDQAKRWLESVVSSITTAERRPRGEKPITALNLAVTSPGLVALGLDDDAMQTFPREYLEGITYGERTRVLGDTDDSAPERWQVGGPKTDAVHLLLLLYATSAEHLADLTTAHWNPSDAASGLKEVFRQNSFKEGVKEPFGFRDGISQPSIEGGTYKDPVGQTTLKAGEFLLGYINEYAVLPPMPTVAAAQDTANALPPDVTASARRAFGINGSYLVWRKLAQDVAGFWKFMDDHTKNADGASDPAARERLAAKFVGRWPSGAPLTLAPNQDDPALGADAGRNNSFLFMPTDADGFACPLGAHVRRSNPRDTMPPNPGKSVVVANRHRIIRRGRPYKEAVGSGPTAGEEVGLVFIAVNADIQRQFEFIQQTWINSPKFGGLYDNKDPLAGDDDGTGVMSIQSRPVRQCLHAIPRFTQARGGGYFFLPGMRALRFLIALPSPPPVVSSPTPPAVSSPGPTTQTSEQSPAEPPSAEQPPAEGSSAMQPSAEQPSSEQPPAQPSTTEPSSTERPPSAPPLPAVTPEGSPGGTTIETEDTMLGLHRLWSAAVAEEKKLHDEFLNLRELLDKKFENLMAKPDLIRPVFTFLRRHQLIFVAPHVAVVSKYADVLEVLTNDAAFSVTEIYAKKMEATTGDFVLGMANTPQYQREIGLMQQATRPEDLAAIQSFVATCAGDLAREAEMQGELDVVGGLSRLVPTRLVGDGYFGAPGPDEATTMRWMRTIFREIFLNLGNDPKMAQEADVSSKELNPYLDALIATRKASIAAGEAVPDDFLCRLLKIQAASSEPIADEVIRRILGGTIVGTVDTNSKAIAQAIDQLLDRPQELAVAQSAARLDNDDLLAHSVFEALRFNPQNPFLLRYCEKPYTVAAGTDRATLISPGSLVLVGTESAMFDPEAFPDPDVFRADRPLENYLHFGHGQHTCFGRHIAGVLIPGTAKALLRCMGLRRAEGASGQIQYDGAFPDRLMVSLDPA